jgi:hypothetical protein
MASYFVARHAQPDGFHAVHDRSSCPPGCFPGERASEYLGEFMEAEQAVTVARVRYPHARGCPCCGQATAAGLLAPRAQFASALTSLRS